MRLNIWEYLKDRLFGRTEDKPSEMSISDPAAFLRRYQTCQAQRLAFYAGVRLIASALAQCEVRTFRGGKEVRKADWYLWNVKPGQNTSSFVFWHDLIFQLFFKGEALVVNLGSDLAPQLVVAESFQHDIRAFQPDVFCGVVARGMALRRSFYMPEVLYFKLSDQNIRILIDQMAEAFNGMIVSGVEAYKPSNGQWGIIRIPAKESGNDDFQEYITDLLNNKFRPVFKSGTGVVPMFDGYAYEDHTSQQRSNAHSQSADVEAMQTAVLDHTARALGIPPALLRGEVAGIDDAWQLFLSTLIDPLAAQISTELTGKLFAPADVIAGARMQMDTSTIEHISITSLGANVDKLIANGIYSVNDVRRKVKEPVIDEGWASQHYITLNYTTMGNKQEKGGERAEDNQTDAVGGQSETA